MKDQDYNCERCKKLNTKEIRSNNRACDKIITKKPIFKHPIGISFYTCPSNYYIESYLYWFDVYQHVKNGGIKIDLSTPNKFIEAINFIEKLKSGV